MAAPGKSWSLLHGTHSPEPCIKRGQPGSACKSEPFPRGEKRAGSTKIQARSKNMSEINLRCFFSCFRARTKPSNAEMQQMKQVMLFAAELWLFSAKIHQHRILIERIQITQAVRVPKVTYPKMNEEASKEQQPDSHWHSLPFVEMPVSCLH